MTQSEKRSSMRDIQSYFTAPTKKLTTQYDVESNKPQSDSDLDSNELNQNQNESPHPSCTLVLTMVITKSLRIEWCIEQVVTNSIFFLFEYTCPQFFENVPNLFSQMGHCPSVFKTSADHSAHKHRYQNQLKIRFCVDLLVQ